MIFFRPAFFCPYIFSFRHFFVRSFFRPAFFVDPFFHLIGCFTDKFMSIMFEHLHDVNHVSFRVYREIGNMFVFILTPVAYLEIRQGDGHTPDGHTQWLIGGGHESDGG